MRLASKLLEYTRIECQSWSSLKSPSSCEGKSLIDRGPQMKTEVESVFKGRISNATRKGIKWQEREETTVNKKKEYQPLGGGALGNLAGLQKKIKKLRVRLGRSLTKREVDKKGEGSNIFSWRGNRKEREHRSGGRKPSLKKALRPTQKKKGE